MEWLVKQGVIPIHKSIAAEAVVDLRNLGSHPEQQTILPPGPAIGLLPRIAEDINSLFPTEG